jgi:hypothetical protein
MSEAVEKRVVLYNVALNLGRALGFLCKETMDVFNGFVGEVVCFFGWPNRRRLRIVFAYDLKLEPFIECVRET